MPLLKLASGELGSIEIIPRQEAMDILSRPAPRRTWFGQKYRLPYRVSRGPGAAVDLINYGLRVKGKCRVVMRIGAAPWRNKPVVAAVGPNLADQCLYLMRNWAAGISSEDLVEFIAQVNLNFPHVLQQRYPDRPPFRYMLSLESMAGWLIESPFGSICESPPLAGHIYHRAGALYAGQTKSGAQPTRYVDPTTQQIKSVYRAGHNTIAELRREGIPLIDDGPKHRFVFITGVAAGSLEYAACRAVLPDWVREYEWGEHGLGWIQPRLLVALHETLSTWLVMRLGQRVQPSQNQS